MIEIFAKNGVYGFRSETLKIEFSEPRIQGFDDYAYLKSASDIMYYYYGVDGFVKHGKKWKKVFEAGAYDFPGILGFKGMLEAFQFDKIGLKKYQKDVSQKDENRMWYTYEINNGALVEDFYSIIHEITICDKEERSNQYSVTVGKALDYSGAEVIGLTFRHLSADDIEKIYECVCEFIEYSLMIHNKENQAFFKAALKSWANINGKLYVMNEDGVAVENIYPVGSNMDYATVMVGDINGKDYHSKTINNFVIEKVEDDGIIINGGYEENHEHNIRSIEKPEKILFSMLVGIFEDMPDKRLAYNEEEIQKDFVSILSDFEKNEFKVKNVEFLFEKYKSAIMDRSWMCREEHNLPQRVKDMGAHENVYASIKVIIENIKNELSAD